MPEKNVSIRNTKDGLVLVMDDKQDMDSICSQMEAKLKSAGTFFKGAMLNIKYRGRQLNTEEEKRIIDILSNSSGAHIGSFTRVEGQKADKADITNTAEKTEADKGRSARLKIKKQAFFTGIDVGPTKFHKGTLRSGKLLEFDGNTVIIGDVNPGAEIRASGNVIVMGTLRGVVHAGCDGNRESVIAALSLQPTQLRIADVISRAPDSHKKTNENAPEISYVQDGNIIIEKLLQQHK